MTEAILQYSSLVDKSKEVIVPTDTSDYYSMQMLAERGNSFYSTLLNELQRSDEVR